MKLFLLNSSVKLNPPLFIVLFLMAVSCYAEQVNICNDDCIDYLHNNPPVATVHNNEELICRHVNRSTGEVVLLPSRSTEEIVLRPVRNGSRGFEPTSVPYIQCVVPGGYADWTTFCRLREDAAESDDWPCHDDQPLSYFNSIHSSGHDKKNEAFNIWRWYALANPEVFEKILPYKFFCGFKVWNNATGSGRFNYFKSNTVSFTVPDYERLPAPKAFSYQRYPGQGFLLQWSIDSAFCDQVFCPNRRQYLTIDGFLISLPIETRWLLVGETMAVNDDTRLGIVCEPPSPDHFANSAQVTAREQEAEETYPDFSNSQEPQWQKGEIEITLEGDELKFDCHLKCVGADNGTEKLRLPELLQRLAVVRRRWLADEFVSWEQLIIFYQPGYSYLIRCQQNLGGEWVDIQKECIAIRKGKVVRVPSEKCVYRDHRDLSEL